MCTFCCNEAATPRMRGSRSAPEATVLLRGTCPTWSGSRPSAEANTGASMARQDALHDREDIGGAIRMHSSELCAIRRGSRAYGHFTRPSRWYRLWLLASGTRDGTFANKGGGGGGGGEAGRDWDLWMIGKHHPLYGRVSSPSDSVRRSCIAAT